MAAVSVLYPMLALVGWTLGIVGFMGYKRLSAVRARRVHPREFLLGETAAVPQDVAVVNRNYMNLLELPVLFYAVSLACYVTQRVDATALALAWAYVALRVAHSLVHLTTNHLPHRLGTFALSNFALAGLFIWLLAQLA